MGIARLSILVGLAPLCAWAEVPALDCVGTAPGWSLQLRQDTAEFAYFDRASSLDIPQRSTAEGRDWPRAMTLVGPRDSAIVVLHQRLCDGQPYEVQVLTQRGETPVLLTGCCAPTN